ncbi:hypothetical protein [Cytobacillus sp. FSL H8-0458]|uniref:hypothetical protein n=1 Tax=Cytobacillus sp. FSL H8-0458 TaxID=2975346 RepID=UPI0030FA1660
MKNLKLAKVLSVGALSALLLTACGGQEQSSSEPKEDPKPAEQKEVSNKEEETTESAATNGSSKPEKDKNGKVTFTEAGQKDDVDGGTLELLKIKTINETIEVAPIKVTIKDIKLFKMSNLDDETKEFMSIYNDNQPVGDEFIYVQVAYDAENLEEKNIGWSTLMNAVTDKGQQVNVDSNDFIYTDSDGDSEFLGKVKKEFADGFIVKDPDIAKLKLIWGNTFDTDTYDTITNEQQVEYQF